MQGFFSLIKRFFNHPWWDVLEEALHGETPLTPPIIITQVKPPTPMPQTANELKLYNTAKGLLGQILAADNAADGYGMYGCAETVNTAFTRAFGGPIGGGASTALMLTVLEQDKRFEECTEAKATPGTIAICATGTSTFGPDLHGHVSIRGVNWYMSNDSETATFEANYPLNGWVPAFAARGFITRWFRIK